MLGVWCLFEKTSVCGSGLTGASGNARQTQTSEWGLATSSGWREWQGEEGAVQTQGMWPQTVTHHTLCLDLYIESAWIGSKATYNNFYF